MQILLVEDNTIKSKEIVNFLKENYPNDEYLVRHSYQSGLKEIMTGKYDLILLDMQLPTFDIKPGEDGYKFKNLAGQDILNELKRKKKSAKVIVVTQFETFGEGKEFKELKDLKKDLKRDFPDLYIDTVYYKANLTIWEKELKEIINSTFHL